MALVSLVLVSLLIKKNNFRIWFRKFHDLSEVETIALLFKNYKRQEETCNLST